MVSFELLEDTTLLLAENLFTPVDLCSRVVSLDYMHIHMVQ